MDNTPDKIDEFEAVIANAVAVDCPLKHVFTPGLYLRTVFVPAGTWLTSKIHKTEHPFIISKGRAKVLIDNEAVELEAPYQGVTKVGTRRVVYVMEDMVWTTIHANEDDCQDLLEIENRVIEAHDNELLSEEIKLKHYLTQKECHSYQSQVPEQVS